MGALNGIRVLDLSRVLAGPWCGQILADLGAEVIKIERPKVGDDTRSWGPPWMKDDSGQDTQEAAYYQSTNRNKLSVAIDIANPDGQELIKALIQDTDVVIENYKAGSLKKYGLDYESLSAINPKLVYCSITGFGQTGPRAEEPGYDFIIQGMGGLMSVTGERDDLPGGGPQKVGVAFSDLATGLYSTIAIQAALLNRHVTGLGQYIDMALLDVQIATMANQGMNYLSSEISLSVMAMHTLILCLIKCSKLLTVILLSRVEMTLSLFNSVEVLVYPIYQTMHVLPEMQIALSIAMKLSEFYKLTF